MYSVPEQLTSANRTGVETLVNIASTAFGGVERLAALNLNAVRMLMEDSAANTRALLAINDMQSLTTFRTALAQPGLDKVSTYSRSVHQIATETQEALSSVVAGQVTELAKNSGLSFSKVARTA